MDVTALHPRFGVEIGAIDLREVTAEHAYPDIRRAFETHSLLLFRDQQLDDEAHLALGALFGPVEDRSMGKNGPKPRMDNVTNRLGDGRLSQDGDFHTLNLIANQLWHTDSTFLPMPALVNILAARVLSSTGGETEFVSTRAAWQDMPENLKAKARHAVLRHRAAHSRAKISADLAKQERFTKWPDRAWRAPNQPQACAISQTAIDDLAAKMEMDSYDFFLKNLDLTKLPDLYRAEMEVAAKHYDMAIAACNRGLARSPGANGKTWLLQMKADSLMHTGKKTEARQTLEEALQAAKEIPDGMRDMKVQGITNTLKGLEGATK